LVSGTKGLQCVATPFYSYKPFDNKALYQLRTDVWYCVKQNLE
jgi:hypothetical protein